MLLRRTSSRIHAWGAARLCVQMIGSIPNIEISPEVTHAIHNHIPVVALESTIISHGMPFPRNVEVAKDVERIVRENGAVPATIGVVGGKFKVGLSESDLARLGNSKEENMKVYKASRRDLSFMEAIGGTAGTTVAGTMILAERAGIRVFATGGIGGVHRGAELTMDISADLIELGRTPVCVVCAGVKSILDIPKTLEVLETQGVPVVSWACDEFPAFFTNKSGMKNAMVVSGAREVARMLLSSHHLGLRSGMVVGVPNPSPRDATEIESLIQEAILLAEQRGIKGAACTPFLLEQLESLSGGKSLTSNISLILNNAKVAAQIAVEYEKLVSMGPKATAHKFLVPSAPTRDHFTSNTFALSSSSSSSSSPGADGPGAPRAVEVQAPTQPSGQRMEGESILVFGGSVIDMIGKSADRISLGTSNPGVLGVSFGGVGRNIAEALARLGARPSLISVVADDDHGHSLLAHAAKAGVDVSKMKIVAADSSTGVVGLQETTALASPPNRTTSTATYTAIHNNDGDLCVGVADMAIFERLTPPMATAHAGTIRKSRMVVVDGNLRQDTFTTIVQLASVCNVPIFFEPTSSHKCHLPLVTNTINQIDIVKPNVSELCVMADWGLRNDKLRQGKAAVSQALQFLNSQDIAEEADPYFRHVRVLAFALHGMMMASAAGGPKLVTAVTTSEGMPRKVRGKHVIVSLGPRGALWCGPKEVVTRPRPGQARDAAARSQATADTVVLDDFTATRVFAAAVPRNVVNASGAGDTMCAGIIAAMLSGACHELDGVCVEAGLRAASKSLESSNPVPGHSIENVL